MTRFARIVDHHRVVGRKKRVLDRVGFSRGARRPGGRGPRVPAGHAYFARALAHQAPPQGGVPGGNRLGVPPRDVRGRGGALSVEHREERPERVRADEALGAPSERPRRRRGAGVLVERHRRHGHRGADDPPDLRRVAGTRVDRAGAPPRGRGAGSRKPLTGDHETATPSGRGDVARRVARRVISRARVWMRRVRRVR